MKERVFHLRKDQDPGANIRRMYAYIRSITPSYRPPGRMERKIQMRRAGKPHLFRVK